MAASVIIVGGGFAGAEVARRLGTRCEVTLISADNFLLFTPMLAEVAGADVEPRHILAPLRQLCPHARVVVGEVTSVSGTTVEVVPEVGGATRTYTADALVLAAGSVPATFGVAGVEDHALGFKDIEDALQIRRRILAFLEEAAESGDPLLTSVAVVGAGYSGAEVAAALADFMYHAQGKYYRSAPVPQISLVDLADRVAPTLPHSLSDAAAAALVERGVRLVLGQKVERVTGGGVVLENGERVSAGTVIWAAGVQAHPIAGAVTSETDRSGRLMVDGNMRVAGNVFALGDIAAVPDGNGGICPPTAQHAIRQGTHLGKTLPRLIAGVRAPTFRYKTLGQLVSLGHRNAVGVVMGVKLSGLAAWFMWRTYYWWRLPTMLRKARVAIDWALDLVFPPDISGLPSAEIGPLPRP